MATILIKIGGDMAKNMPAALLDQLHQLQHGNNLIIVHGAGSDITAACEQAGILEQRVDGLRVTSPATLKIAREIITRHVQPHLLKQLREADVAPAVLQGGIEASVINEQRYGQVGQLSAIDADAVAKQLAGTGALLVGPLLPSHDGGLLNVNADDVAMALAKQLKVTQLHFVTDVPGVLDANGCVVARLTPALMNDLSANSVITGGMSVKLRAGLAVAATHTTKVTIGNVIEPAGTILVA